MLSLVFMVMFMLTRTLTLLSTYPTVPYLLFLSLLLSSVTR